MCVCGGGGGGGGGRGRTVRKTDNSVPLQQLPKLLTTVTNNDDDLQPEEATR